MHIRTTYRRVAAFLMLAVGAAAAGACSSQAGSGGGAADQDTVTQEQASSDAIAGPELEQGANPLLGMLRASLDELNLRHEQRTAIQGIRADLESKTRNVRSARHDLAFVVADQVAAGRVDDTVIDQKLALLVQAVRDDMPALQDALNKLHATLDATQRRELVHKLRDKGAVLRDKVEDRGGPRAVVRARLGRLADQLELTGEQKLTIRDRAREEFQGVRPFDDATRAEVRARLREIGQAFMTDQFDARSLDIGREAPDVTRKVSSALVRFVRVVVPVLTPEQRTRFAAVIRDQADHRP